MVAVMRVINGLVQSACRFFCLFAIAVFGMAALPALADTRLLVLGDSLVAGYGLPP